MDVSDILARLEGVRERGAGRWMARCPAHEDRSPSLSIRELDDRVLVHCFSGCEPSAIAAAIGLELRELFRDGVRRRRVDELPRLSASDALAALGHETAVVAHVAAEFIERRAIDEETWKRLALAHRRISDACCVTGAWR